MLSLGSDISDLIRKNVPVSGQYVSRDNRPNYPSISIPPPLEKFLNNPSDCTGSFWKVCQGYLRKFSAVLIPMAFAHRLWGAFGASQTIISKDIEDEPPAIGGPQEDYQ